MIVLLRIVLRLLAELTALIALSVRPRRAIEAENWVLRRQLALFKERGMKQLRLEPKRRMKATAPRRAAGPEPGLCARRCCSTARRNKRRAAPCRSASRCRK